MIKKFLNKILPPEEKIFYNNLEDASKVCKESAKLFVDIVQSNITDEKLVDAKRLKYLSNDIYKQTMAQLNATFITPIDREDIQHVSLLLNKITKKIVRACLNLKMYRLESFNVNLQNQAENLYTATEEMINIVSKLKKNTLMKEITESNQKMKEIETHGDEIFYIELEDLFSGRHDAISVIKLRDIYKDIENALDACFSVSDAVVSIVLKIS